MQLDAVRVNFLLGPGRSGTTLLMLMLNEHPSAISTPEIKHLLYFYSKYRNISEVTSQLKKDIAAYFNEQFASGRLKAGFTFNLQGLLSSLTPGEKINYAGLCKRIYLAFEYNNKKSEDIRYIFDKNPFYALTWRKLLDVYPDTRFLLSMRDYRAYVASCYFSPDPYSGRYSVYYHAMVWTFFLRKTKEMLDEVPEKCLPVSYESLVEDPEKQLELIYSFFGMEPAVEASLRYHETVARIIAEVKQDALPSSLQRKITNLAKPVYSEALDNWKSKLSVQQIKICDFICAKEASQFGYQPMYKLSAFEKLRFSLAAAPHRFRVWLVFQLSSVKIEHYLKVKRRIRKIGAGK